MSKLKLLPTIFLCVNILSLGSTADQVSAQTGISLSFPFARRSAVTCDYGCYSGHVGIDYRAVTGTSVVAASAGTVTEATNTLRDGEVGNGG